jgi:molybdate transport system substrate-binding protein
MRRAALLALLLGAGLSLGGCTSSEDGPTLTVFAATPLRGAFEELGRRFEEANPGVDVRFEFADAQELASRLADGAAADLIATDDVPGMNGLLRADLVQSPAELTASAVFLARAQGVELAGIEDLAREGLRLVLPAADVPLGRYARDVIAAGAAEYGAEWETAVLANVVEGTLSSGDVLEMIESGKADAAFLYQPDVSALALELGIGALPLPARLALAVVYPAALTAQPPELVLARAFLEFALSDEGQDVLGSFGFGADQ